MSEPTSPSGPPPSHPRHRAIHRNFRWTMLGMVVSLPLLILFWAYNRTVTCWAHGAAGAFELFVCPNSGIVFGFYVVLLVIAMVIIHSPVPIPGETPAPSTRSLPVFARLRRKRRRESYRRGFAQLDQHTQETLLFADLLVPVVVALAVALVFGIPRLLR